MPAMPNEVTPFLGILPLLIFVVADIFLGPRKAVVVALVLAVAETVFTFVTFGELDSVTVLSLLIIVLFGLVAIYKNQAIYLKVAPSLISLFLGIYLLGTYLWDAPLLLVFATKYQKLLPAQLVYNLRIPYFRELLNMATLTLGFGTILHGLATGYAAFRMSNWWWIAIRGIGFYLFAFLSFFAAVFITKMILVR